MKNEMVLTLKSFCNGYSLDVWYVWNAPTRHGGGAGVS